MAVRNFLTEYTLGDLLGKGAFSAVYNGIHNKTGQRYAIKVIDKTKLTPKDVESIVMEINLLSTIDHPNVLRMYDHHSEKDKVYIVTELCEGGELFDRITQREYYAESDAQTVLRDIAKALQHCHAKKIVHRDLKPENILLLTPDADSPLKIADFGFAKQMMDAQDLTTALGTPTYIAPEVLKREPYDTSVDLWSLGVIAYVLLCGYPPFYADTNPEMFVKIKRCQYQFDEQYWSEISDEAKDLIRKLLVVNPTDRLDINGVLAHPWMTRSLESKDITPALSELRGLLARRRLKRGIGAVVAMTKIKSAVRASDGL
jgi:serine/threonine protein kinase